VQNRSVVGWSRWTAPCLPHHLRRRHFSAASGPGGLAFLLRLGLLAVVSTACLPAQPGSEFLALLDRFARTFTAAKAGIRTTNHVVGVKEDDVETGTIFVKRSGGKSQFLITFTAPNTYTAAVREQVAEVYYPKLNEIHEYDIRSYKDIAQKLFLLGFGMPGRELAANYDVRNVRHETVDSQPATYLELVPKSADVLSKLKRVELWIADSNQCPVRQTFHFPDGGFRTAQFSALEVNPKLPASAFDFPKGAKRVRMN